ncbi:MAG: hypothetical protein WB245_11605 [Acidimicrobiia bacterium]
MLVAVLAVSVSVVAWPAIPARAATQTLYLKGDGVPKASLSDTAPNSGSLPNYDANRDGEPGLVLQRSSKGWSESNQKKYQIWVAPSGGMDLDADVNLTLWSAVKGFANQGRGRVEAYLLDCSTGGGNCSLLAQDVIDSEPWSQSTGWSSRTYDFGHVSHVVASNRSLAVKIVAGDAAADDMWLAYDTASFDAGLSMAGPMGASTTTSTTVSSTSTTTAPVTTTTSPGGGSTTTSVGGGPPITPPGRSTTTTSTTSPTPGASTTSTTVSGPTTTTLRTTTTSLGVVAGNGTGGSPPDEPRGIGGVDDPTVLAIGSQQVESDIPNEERSWAGSALDGLELVIPPWAAGMVVSPLMVIGFVFDAMTDSGRAIMLPLVLLLAGMLWVLVENRGMALFWWREAKKRVRRTG